MMAFVDMCLSEITQPKGAHLFVVLYCREMHPRFFFKTICSKQYPDVVIIIGGDQKKEHELGFFSHYNSRI